MKVFVVGPWMRNPVVHLFQIYGWEVTSQLKDADLVNFNGGADINPAIYGAKRHLRTHFNPERDTYELLVYEKARKLGKRMSGICRGGQLLNAVCGGTMWQDVNGHGFGTHEVKDILTGEKFKFNTIHHQMMISGKAGITLAEAYESTKKETLSNDGLPHSVGYINKSYNAGDAEVIMYWDPEPRLCFQAHPEFDVLGDTGKQFMRYVDEYVFEGKIESEVA